jgi:carbonic anhydrase
MSIHEITSRKTNVSGEVEILLLTCLDFRMIELMRQYMTSLWLYRKYDHIVLGGASLGAVTEKYPAWNQTFWDHLRLVIDMHGVRKVIVIDHRDCGAYRVITGEDLIQDRERETLVHAWYMRTLARLIREAYPALEVELLLMDLHGSVERIE